MDISDTVVILESDAVRLAASGRVISMNIDGSKIEIRIENPVSRFRFGEVCHFELTDNGDGTYEALYLQPIPGTNGMVNRILRPTFVIGGAIVHKGNDETFVSEDLQPALF